MPGLLISVVVPAHNEHDSIEAVIVALSRVLQSSCGEAFEIIVVDDGSTDGTDEVVQRHQDKLPQLTLCRSPNRRGQSGALLIGFSSAKGELIGTIDGDGQQDPEDFAKLFALVHEGRWDYATGIRANRKDSFAKRLFSRVANFAIQRLFRVSTLDSGCSLRVFRRELLVDLLPFKGMHRFIPLLFILGNRRGIAIGVDHRPRFAGKSHYGVILRGIVCVFDGLMLWWWAKRLIPMGAGDSASVIKPHPLVVAPHVKPAEARSRELA